MAGRVGQVMLAAGLVVVAAGAVATLPRALRVRRLALRLRTELSAHRTDLEASLARLAAGRKETQELMVPLRRVWRWSRHPLVVALLQWSLRRRRRP